MKLTRTLSVSKGEARVGEFMCFGLRQLPCGGVGGRRRKENLKFKYISADSERQLTLVFLFCCSDHDFCLFVSAPKKKKKKTKLPDLLGNSQNSQH